MLVAALLLAHFALSSRAHGSHSHSHSHDDDEAAVAPFKREPRPATPSARLLHAAKHGFPADELSALLREGASLDAADPENGFTALHWAANEARDASRLPSWHVLLRAGAKVGARDAEGATPLHRAAINDCLAMAELLLLAGADIDARDTHGFTPLMYAARFARPDTGVMLVAKGADVRPWADSGRPPTDGGTHSPLVIARHFSKDHPRQHELIAALEKAEAALGGGAEGEL